MKFLKGKKWKTLNKWFWNVSVVLCTEWKLCLPCKCNSPIFMSSRVIVELVWAAFKIASLLVMCRAIVGLSVFSPSNSNMLVVWDPFGKKSNGYRANESVCSFSNLGKGAVDGLFSAGTPRHKYGKPVLDQMPCCALRSKILQIVPWVKVFSDLAHLFNKLQCL